MTDFNDRVERLAEIEGKPTPGQFAIDFYNEALPLLREMAKALSEAQADARVFSNSYNALAEDFGRLKEENERLRKFIHGVQDDKLHTSSECQSLKSENERLREGIGRALGELEAGKPGDAESILEALHDA